MHVNISNNNWCGAQTAPVITTSPNAANTVYYELPKRMGSSAQNEPITVPCIEIAPDTKKDTNPKDAIAGTKIPFHLWPETASIWGAMGLLEGALKYGRANWRESGVRASVYFDALRRHSNKWFEGEDTDPDSGLPHFAHMLACVAILVDAEATGKLIDDRNYAVNEGYVRAVTEATEHVNRLKRKYASMAPKHYDHRDLPTTKE